MRAFKHNGRLFQILFAALLCASIFPNRLLADDKDTSNPPAKAAPAKSDAPKMEAPIPLTERERWLLDRVELLEKRVEELESKSHPAATATAEAATPPIRVGASTPVAGTVTTAGTFGQVTPGGSNATPARVGHGQGQVWCNQDTGDRAVRFRGLVLVDRQCAYKGHAVRHQIFYARVPSGPSTTCTISIIRRMTPSAAPARSFVRMKCM